MKIDCAWYAKPDSGSKEHVSWKHPVDSRTATYKYRLDVRTCCQATDDLEYSIQIVTAGSVMGTRAGRDIKLRAETT